MTDPRTRSGRVAPTETEHDEKVEQTGRPYTDRWFPWLVAVVWPDDQRGKQ